MTRILTLACLFSLCVLDLACQSGPPEPGQRGNTYAMECNVQKDGSLEVSEHLTVEAGKEGITHGVWREFPQEFVGCQGERREFDIQIQDVLRDGEPAQHHKVALPGTTRLYVGEEGTTLESARYAYTLKYRTSPVVEIRDGHCWLCWDIVGEGLTVPLKSLRAEFLLPRSVPAERLQAESSMQPPAEDADVFDLKVAAGRVQITSTAVFEAGRTLRARISWPSSQTGSGGED